MPKPQQRLCLQVRSLTPQTYKPHKSTALDQIYCTAAPQHMQAHSQGYIQYYIQDNLVAALNYHCSGIH